MRVCVCVTMTRLLFHIIIVIERGCYRCINQCTASKSHQGALRATGQQTARIAALGLGPILFLIRKLQFREFEYAHCFP